MWEKVTWASRLDQLQRVHAVPQVLHRLRSKVFRSLDLQQEDGRCSINSVGLRQDHMPIAKGPAEEAKDQQGSVSRLEALSEMVLVP